MSLNPLPKVRKGITKDEMTWNELFYYCLQKNFWLAGSGAVFLILLGYAIVTQMLTGFMQILVLLLVAIGVVYLVGALPASIIYATVVIAKRKKQMQ